MAAEYVVFVVVDKEYGELLCELARQGAVWIIDTPINRAVAVKARAERPNAIHLVGVTTFTSKASFPEESFLDELGMIDLHHGPYSADPPYRVLEIIGASLTESLKAALGQYGFDEFRSTTTGFRAVRTVSPMPLAPPRQTRAIEVHDSALDQITLEQGVAVLHFPQVYIHSSEGRPAIDDGTCWTQEAVIRIGDAKIEGGFSKESREAYGGYAHYLSDGSLTIDGIVSDNLIPIPLEVNGEIDLLLECWGEIVRIHGNSAVLELIGTAVHVEEFRPIRD